MRHVRFHALTICGLLASTALAAPAIAQVAIGPPPPFLSVDANGVDLVSGELSFAFTEAVMGSGDGAVSLMRHWTDDGYRDNWSNGLFFDGSGKAFVESGVVSDVFQLSGGSYVPLNASGGTLTANGLGYLYTARDGTRIQFRMSSPDNGLPLQGFACGSGVATGACAVPVSVTQPNGMVFTLNWDFVDRCDDPINCVSGTSYYRFRGVSSGAGYSFTMNYVSNNPGVSGVPRTNWWIRNGATFANSVIACSGECPSVTYSTSGATLTITDALGRQWKFTNNSSNRLAGIRRPGETSDSTTVAYNSGGGIVSSVTRDGVTTSYSRSVAGNTATMTITNALSQQTVVTSDLTIGRPTSVKDALNRTTTYQYDSSGRLTKVTRPEGNFVENTYDSRGNVTQTRAVAKAGSGLPDIVTSASFDAACSNPVTCNSPNSTTDARGNVTDYTWDSTHGGLLTVTAPAPTAGADRPQTRYSYTLTNGRHLLTGVSQCQTTASCTGAADETKVAIAYNGNVLPSSVTRSNGTGTLSATTAMTYDAAGNLLTEDGPLTGAADTTRYRYDAARQLLGLVSPDPDGTGGALKPRAIRMTYRPDGQVSKQELGTVVDQSGPAWANFLAAQAVDVTYDANARVATQKLSSGGTAYALTQFSYDPLGRPDCAAVRMNPAIYASLPSSACTLGTTGSFGPDRIGQVVYDAAGQVIQNKVALGTADAATERTLTYTGNAMLATLKDAEDNLTTYEYDGHDRLSKTRFPVASPKGANASSTTDYEQLTYENPAGGTRTSGTVASRRLRDGSSIAYSYDALGRLTGLAPPNPDPTRIFAYDNLGRMTSASKFGISLSFAYDALGRLLSETGPNGTVASQWDVAGRRTRLTYPGSFFLDYDYLVTGETTAIRENGTTSLASFTYDDLGRRTLLIRGNGRRTMYEYDPVSRLSALINTNFASQSDVRFDFTYNPAHQIVTRAASNDAYSWTGHGSGTTSTTVNGLNQIATIDGTAATHDARGNLTFDPASGKSYSYWPSDNQLHVVSSPWTSLGYDTLSRLASINAGGVTTNLAYDGIAMIAEYDGAGALQKRYVFGPGVDEPLVEYDSAGNRRFLEADERGSIILVASQSGATIATNRYGEYGKPQSGNLGRFQYTGQMWLPNAGGHHYKNRFLINNSGRFAQTDPIGYWGGPNLYAYVLNDPVNFVDPLGLCGPGQIEMQHPGEETRTEDGTIVVTAGRFYCGQLPIVRDAGNLGIVGGEIVVTGIRPGAADLLISAAGNVYIGLTFCPNPTWGGRDFFYPSGRVNSGKPGGANPFSTALADLDRIARTNDINPLGATPGFITAPLSQFPLFSIPVGGGWWGYTNPRSGFTTFENSGLGFRFNAKSNEVSIELLPGTVLPAGGTIDVLEVCHYY